VLAVKTGHLAMCVDVWQKPKVKETVSLTRYSSSSSSLSGRLEPLRSSPLHDERFHALKPIPPTKKFLKWNQLQR